MLFIDFDQDLQAVLNAFYTHLCFPASDVISDNFGGDFLMFRKVITEKNIAEETESIMGACVERNLPQWICIPEITSARDGFCITPIGTGLS